MKPHWSTAPDWAKWLAKDRDGCWFWYEDKPYTLSKRWQMARGFCQKDETCLDYSWKETLEPRPEVSK